ncbi:MAG: cupredoxin family copper-binding protein [Patescibacteria group bacterium]|nr:cupredoxin family copper-binding protein [Patescibacteria group bacterium]MDE1945649.1 cupredoxin family copper-binding protein [Patescibacteria group bacterium]
MYFIARSFGPSAAPSSVPAVETAAQTGSSATPAQASVSNAPAPVAVNIRNFSFSPATLAVPAGTKVTWTNGDAVEHTVTANNSLFDSKPLAPGQSFSYTFTTAGSVAYHCAIHPMMTGTVVVR